MTKTPEVIAGMTTRIAANAATMPPEEQSAFMEFFNAFAQIMPQQGKQMGVLGGQ